MTDSGKGSAHTGKTNTEALMATAADMTLRVLDAQEAHRAALASYARGEIALFDVRQVEAGYLAALDDERLHGEALKLALEENAVLDAKEREEALVTALNISLEKRVLLIGAALRRQEAAERELRAATYATRNALQVVEGLQVTALPDGHRLLALRGQGPDTQQRVPTQTEKDEMLRLLAPWRLERGQLPSPPPELLALSSNPANSDDDHARRWKGVLAEVAALN